MSAPERILAWPWEVNPNMGQWETQQSIRGEGVEYIHADTVAETIRQAVQAELEACADVVAACADAFAQVAEHPGVDTDEVRRSESILRSIAVAIRARGDA